MLRLKALLMACLLGVALPAAAQTPIKVSYQPALFWALPFYLATVQGWWKEIGLAPEFATFAAGAPQVAAAAARAWDVGGTGSAPAVLGAQRFGILTIGVTNDESQANALVARSKDAARIRANPASLRGQHLLVTTNSTGEYAAFACLRHWGLQPRDMLAMNMGQAQIVSAFSSGNGLLAAVWAPNIATLEDRADSTVVCSGKEAGATVPGALVVRADYARENPGAVAAFLAVYLRGITWEHTHRAETLDLMRRFYAEGGVTLPDRFLARELDTRPTFTLEQQLKLFDRTGGAAVVDGWFSHLGEYLHDSGTLTQIPEAGSFITSDYLRRVAADPKLTAFASGQ